MGEGTVDYKDALGLGGNLLPPLLVVSGDSGLVPSDNRLADVVGEDGVPEMAIGRITVSTPEELEAYLDKIEAYETSNGTDWADRTIFVADDPDETGDYSVESDRLASLLPTSLEVERVYLEDLGPVAAHGQLVADLVAGASFLSFVGHAGTTVLTHESILSIADLDLLTNGEHLPVVSAVTCHLGNFALAGFPSLGEELVLHADGGAAAVWTSTALSFHLRRIPLGRELVRIVGDGQTNVLGDAILLAIQRAARTSGGRETLDSQVLLGDPALRLRIGDVP